MFWGGVCEREGRGRGGGGGGGGGGERERERDMHVDNSFKSSIQDVKVNEDLEINL